MEKHKEPLMTWKEWLNINANIIDKWLKENGNPEIEKQVENEYKEIMKTQTAVEYLIKGLPMVYWEDPYYSDLLEQAKEMEKQQIIDAYQQGFNNAYFNNPLSK
jgi:hypothetical protein